MSGAGAFAAGRRRAAARARARRARPRAAPLYAIVDLVDPVATHRHYLLEVMEDVRGMTKADIMETIEGSHAFSENYGGVTDYSKLLVTVRAGDDKTKRAALSAAMTVGGVHDLWSMMMNNGVAYTDIEVGFPPAGSGAGGGGAAAGGAGTSTASTASCACTGGVEGGGSFVAQRLQHSRTPTHTHTHARTHTRTTCVRSGHDGVPLGVG